MLISIIIYENWEESMKNQLNLVLELCRCIHTRANMYKKVVPFTLYMSCLTQLSWDMYLRVCYAGTPELVIPLRMGLGETHLHSHTQ